MTIKARGILYLAIGSILFGSVYLLIKIAGETIPPMALATGRAGVAAVCVYVFLRLQGDNMPRIGKAWIPFLILGIFNALGPVSLMAFGEEHISSGLASVLSSTTPIMTVILAHFLIDETLTLEKGIGVVVGFTGVLIVLLPRLGQGADFSLIGALAILLAALLIAVSAIYVRRHLSDVPPAKLVVGMTSCAAAVGLLVTFIFENPAQIRPSTEGILAWLALGALCSAVGWLLFFWLVANRGATFATLVLFVQPPIAILLGAVVMGTVVGWPTIIGMAVILLSVAIMDGLLDSPFKRGPQAPSTAT